MGADTLGKAMRGIFENWFSNSDENLNILTTSVCLLSHLSRNDMPMFISMLTYIFKFIPSHQARIKHIFKEIVRGEFISLDNVMNNKYVPQHLQ